MDIQKIEYRVRPVTRFIVTRYCEEGVGASVGTLGEYDNESVAYEVGYALCKAEQERLKLTDEMIRYPAPLNQPSQSKAVTPS